MVIEQHLLNLVIDIYGEGSKICSHGRLTKGRFMIGTGELIVILCVVLILFGGKKLPEFAKSLGVGIREFKKAVSGETDEAPRETTLNQTKDTEDPSNPS